MARYNTEQRKTLHDFFSQHPHEMFSAKELAGLLGSGSVSISAVYRNLSGLEAEGLVRKSTKNGSRESYYQYVGTDDCREHVHLTCKKCGKTVHMALDDTDALVERASKYSDFSLDRSETVLIGLCGACRNT